METHTKYIASLFGLTAKNANREKFGFLCETEEQGFVLVQKTIATDENSENILFQHQVKEHLYKKGFTQIDRFFVTEQGGTPCLKSSGDLFTVARGFNKPKADYAQKDQLLAVVAELGKIHKISEGVKFDGEPKKRREATSPEKALGLLSSQKKKLMKAGRFSEFDMIFLKAYEKFEPYIQAWGGIPKDVLGNNNYICHNLLKEENIFMEDKPIFTNFVAASYGHYLTDLVYLVKRYLKAEPQGDLPMADIFEAYKKGHPEALLDQDFFKAKLMYPDKFIKVAKEFYSKNRSFAPKAYLTQMEECLERGIALENYLQL
ncbi:MAG: hypothetical protein FWB98_02190 [Defluviitaleaceae bacterium]|nr:hypothetical protein [Defluviitaleaceae bacterium]